MNVREYYTYLSGAREELWNFLRALPEAELNRPLIEGGDRFQCIKDLVLHVVDVEDHWIHDVARGGQGVAARYPHDWVRPQAEGYALGWILQYGSEVQERSRAFLEGDPDLERRVKLIQDDPQSETVSLDGLLWHVMTHEVRHTAQIALLVRMLGHTPPWLDFLRFMRPQPALAQS
ncbi:putative damage-inducible protein DinB [Deinococcus sp. HSC-46F16]|uniref:DinB family protein n=1 Tax=Deinococcus sp. HSC-46F16 TaxID=2910968 RepID=UPI0020A22860|nr:DinB family protein [Deinococcus sp. HSC-46F16]MCP2015137.1 putative damage-inducible protein DinB [Deinococcus sp. HSC-46F16]